MNAASTVNNRLNKTRRNNAARMAASGAGGAGGAAAAAMNNATKISGEHMALITDIQRRIESNAGSYRFLYTEPKSLDSQYLFVGLNPGGEETDPSDTFIPAGNAVLNENWAPTGTKNPLQQQILYFFEDIATEFGLVEEWIPYMNTKWMISNYVFYRSPNWKIMAAKRAHIQTCKEIWRDVFARKVPKIIVANGYDTHRIMVKLLEELGWKQTEVVLSPRDWEGPHKIQMELNGSICMTVGFAHLSRFPIIRRKENKETLAALYKILKKYQ